jgi:hypothetical protein
MAFCGYLKQSTAVDIILGPFVDETDGKTAETGLTIAQADVRLSKNGANIAQKNDVTSCSHDELGNYKCDLDATDTATLGILTVMVHESGALPVKQEYQVVTAHWYDTMCSTDYLQVDVIQVEGSDATDQIRDAVVDDATRIDASALNTHAAISPATAAALTTHDGKLDTVDGIVDAILIDTGTTLDAALAVVDGNVDAILVDTGTTLPATLTTIDGKIDTVDANVDAVLIDTGTTLQAELDGIQADTEDLQTQIGTAGAGLTAVPWNAAWDAEVESEVTDSLVAHNLDHLALTATVAADMTVEVADNTVLSRILANGDTSAFVPSTDGLQAIRDKQTDIETDTAEIGAAGAGLSAVPWNASWDVEVQSEAADALTAYDPPTKAEMDTAHALLATEAKQDTIDGIVDAILVDTGTTLDAALAVVDGNVDAILVDTGTTLDAALAVVDANVDAILVDTGTTLDAALAVVDANVDAILVDTGTTLPATLTTIEGKVDTVDGVADTILVDTNELQTDWVNGGRLDLLIDQIITDIAALNNVSTAEVNAQVLDVLNTDTFAEPGQGAPAATASLAAKIGYLYKFARNKLTQTATTLSIYDDSGATVDQKATVSDDATTYTRGEIGSGP